MCRNLFPLFLPEFPQGRWASDRTGFEICDKPVTAWSLRYTHVMRRMVPEVVPMIPAPTMQDEAQIAGGSGAGH
jgi:hypothetical protein